MITLTEALVMILFILVCGFIVFLKSMWIISKIVEIINIRLDWGKQKLELEEVELTSSSLNGIAEDTSNGTAVSGKSGRKVGSVIIGLVKGKDITLFALQADGLKVKTEDNKYRALTKDTYYLRGLHNVGKNDLRTPMPLYLLDNDLPVSVSLSNEHLTEEEMPKLDVSTTSNLIDSALLSGLLGNLTTNKGQAFLFACLGSVVTLLLGGFKDIVMAFLF